MSHALKLEVLPAKASKHADEVVETLKDFLNDLGFSSERIDVLECRRRDGFIPYGHNLGGVGGVAFADQYTTEMNGTGFENADETLEKYAKIDIEYYEKDIGAKRADWTEEQLEAFDELRQNDSEATVLFSMDAMLNSFERGVYSVNLRFCVCVKDAPYHRQYDDMFEFDLRFKTISGLKHQLAKIMRNENTELFSSCLNDAY